MLLKMRNGANSLLMKIILSLVAVAMVVSLGVSSLFESGDQVALSVGNKKIRSSFISQELQNFVSSNGLSIEQAAETGYVNAYLDTQRRNILIQNDFESLGTEIAYEEVLNDFESNIEKTVDNQLETFTDLGETARKIRRQQLIQEIRDNREAVLRQRYYDLRQGDGYKGILSSFAATTPQAIKDVQEETALYERSFVSAEILLKDSTSFTDPGDEVLKAFFEENKQNYLTPEQRKGTALFIPLNSLVNYTSVKTPSDQEIKTYYDTNEASFVFAERRKYKEQNFKTEDEAQSFLTSLTPETLQSAFTGTVKTAEKGRVNPSIETALFNLTEGTPTSEILNVGSTFKILQLEERLPTTNKTLAESKNEIIARLKKDAREKAFNEAKTKAETVRLEIGKYSSDPRPLAEIAKESGYQVLDISLIDSAGKGEGTLPPLATRPAFLKEFFAAETKGRGFVQETAQGDLFLAEVGEISPAKPADFSAKRTEILADWQERQPRLQADKTADEFLKNLADSKNLQESLSAYNLVAAPFTVSEKEETPKEEPETAETKTPAQRDKERLDAVAETIFGKTAAKKVAFENKVVVLALDKVMKKPKEATETPEITSEEDAAPKNENAKNLGPTLFAGYVNELLKNRKNSINFDVLERDLNIKIKR